MTNNEIWDRLRDILKEHEQQAKDLAIAKEALEKIAEETGTPYAFTANEALQKLEGK